jgi:hypothetical protein
MDTFSDKRSENGSVDLNASVVGILPIKKLALLLQRLLSKEAVKQ